MVLTAIDLSPIPQRLVSEARAAGADEADALLVEATHMSVSCRMGKVEGMQRSEGRDLGLRVMIGGRQAMVSSSDCTEDALKTLVRRAIEMAKCVPEDPFCGLAPPALLATTIRDLEIDDSEEPDADSLTSAARRAEDAAREIKGVSNSEGAEAGWGRSKVTLAASNGFSAGYRSSGSQLSVSVLAQGENGAMERDYAYSSKIRFADLERPEDIGRLAGTRAVARLGGKKPKSARVPVVFDPRVSRSLLGHLAGAINGAGIARGVGFLKDRMGQRIFPAGTVIWDDPHLARGLRSKPFDGEGVANQRRAIVEDGVLQSWILDLASARQLGMETTGNASRGTSAPPAPSVTNFWMEAGSKSLKNMLSDVGTGFYVTDLIGMGVNGVTGDYSRGAAGFWIENGSIAWPVNEVTVAGNLIDMFLHMIPANRLEHRYGVDAPAILIEEMILAGA